MKKYIYIKILNEGTLVYRPVLSEQIENDLYKVGGESFYNSDLEEWEFMPGSIVKVAENLLVGEMVLIAKNKVA